MLRSDWITSTIATCCGPQPKRALVYRAKLVRYPLKAKLHKNMAANGPRRSGRRVRVMSTPNGLRPLDSELVERRWLGSDSGSQTRIVIQFTTTSAAAANAGKRRSYWPRKPPNAGPKRKPTLTAAPSRPKLRVRSRGLLMSAIYACAAPILPDDAPATRRETYSIVKLVAEPDTRTPTTSPATPRRSTSPPPERADRA